MLSLEDSLKYGVEVEFIAYKKSENEKELVLNFEASKQVGRKDLPFSIQDEGGRSMLELVPNEPFC